MVATASGPRRPTKNTSVTAKMLSIAISSTMGMARRPRADRHQVRVRHGPMRRVYRPYRRSSGALMRTAGLGSGHSDDHDHRGTFPGRIASGTESLGGSGRRPVRILPAGTDHVGGGFAGPESGADRSRDRSRHGRQHLPVRYVPAHPGGGAQRRVEEEGRAMIAFTRRELLRKSLLSGAGLFVAFHVPRKAGAVPQAAGKPPPDPNAFVRVAPDESVTVLLAHSEMGQGIWTGLAMLIAEELDCDWSRIRVEHAPAAPVYAHPAFGMQMTGGSTTTWSEFERYRTAGAMARAMLVRAAAAQWKTDAKRLRTENGFVLRGNDRLSYGQLALAAQAQTPQKSVMLMDGKRW